MKLPTDYVFIDGHIVSAKQVGNFAVVALCKESFVKKTYPRFYLPDEEVCAGCKEKLESK